jgi:hypothetical protein
MSDLTDDIIQESLEGGLPPPLELASSCEKEIGVYRLIFEGMEREPPESMSPDLSAGILHKIKTLNRVRDAGFYLSVALITAAGMAGIYYLLEFLDKNSAVQFADFTGRYRWPFLYALSFVLLIQYLDQKIRRRRVEAPGPSGFM